MRSTHDPGTDALFLHLADVPTHESREVTPDIIFDFDQGGRLVRIEMLNASRTLAAAALPAAAE